MSLDSFPVKITVVKRLFHQDLVDAYADDPSAWAPCKLFEDGAEFITSAAAPWEMPAGFCCWAWGDIYKLVYGMARGGQDVFIACCTDGYRPVVFKLEKMKAGG